MVRTFIIALDLERIWEMEMWNIFWLISKQKNKDMGKFKPKSWWCQYQSFLSVFIPYVHDQIFPPLLPMSKLRTPRAMKAVDEFAQRNNYCRSHVKGSVYKASMLEVLFTRWDIHLLSHRMPLAWKAGNELFSTAQLLQIPYTYMFFRFGYQRKTESLQRQGQQKLP